MNYIGWILTGLLLVGAITAGFWFWWQFSQELKEYPGERD